MTTDHRIDFYASAVHYVDHLAPIWLELDDDDRGDFLAGAGSLAERRADLDYGISTVAPSRARDKTRSVVVASYGDLKAAARSSAVFVEHGAGQAYHADKWPPHPSSPGGPGRETVRLFIVPNYSVAARNTRSYPTTPNAVVGCPKLDPWIANPVAPWTENTGRPPVVALSFRWPCGLAPECRGALEHYRAILPHIARAYPGALAHAHPKIHHEHAALFDRAGLEPVARFNEVLDRADVYAADNSSTLFEFAATGRPVVLLNAPWYRRHVNHGLRFWEAADIGLQVDTPDELAATIRTALIDPPDVALRRQNRLPSVYAQLDGKATKRAAAAMTLLSSRTTKGNACPVCGTPGRSCGPEHTGGTPVDYATEEATTMPANFRVTRDINGHAATVAVTEAELTADERVAFGLDKPKARNKARTTTRNKATTTRKTTTKKKPANSDE